jgi:hypothetical protein
MTRRGASPPFLPPPGNRRGRSPRSNALLACACCYRLVVNIRLGFASAVVAFSVVASVPSAPAEAQLDQLLRGLPGSSKGAGLSDAKIADGLKQALSVGTANAVSFTGKLDGYLANEAIKILLPDNLRTMEQGLRLVGQGARVDEFVVSMNRAAERAAPAARTIFVDAIGAMSFDDARKILQGSETAATEYFKDKTTGKLTTAFAPFVEKAMNEVGVTRQYKELTGGLRALPIGGVEAFDVDRYVITKALDGLFVVVADEEKKIRTNPAARVTDLLKDVFGR